MKTEIVNLVKLVRNCDEQIQALLAQKEISVLKIDLRLSALKHAANYEEATTDVQQQWDKFAKAHPILATELLEILIEGKKSIGDFVATYRSEPDVRSALLKLFRSSPSLAVPINAALN